MSHVDARIVKRVCWWTSERRVSSCSSWPSRFTLWWVNTGSGWSCESQLAPEVSVERERDHHALSSSIDTHVWDQGYTFTGNTIRTEITTDFFILWVNIKHEVIEGQVSVSLTVSLTFHMHVCNFTFLCASLFFCTKVNIRVSVKD